MATTEPTINVHLAELLAQTRSLWRAEGVVRSENTEVLEGSGKRPDILVAELNVSPVVIETEIIPATGVENDAIQRLGETLLPSGRHILSSLAVKMPKRLRNRSGTSLREDIATAQDFEVAVFTGESSEEFSRWPQNGWLHCNIVDLSILIQSASVPPKLVEEAANKLVSGVSEAAALLTEISNSHPGAIEKICEELHQENQVQTHRMAMTILVNALVFHESIAGGPGKLADILTLDELSGNSKGPGKSVLTREWRKILKINYWPIFDISRRILEVIPANAAKGLIEQLVKTANELLDNNLMRSHDLTGAVFQRLIIDRKFLAAFYTHPASAALLVGLAISPERTPANGSWSNPVDITSLRVADLACGTGTLLSTAYRRIGQLHEAAGGNSESLHSSMMAKALIGYDVYPSAAHLTASMLAGAHPTVRYEEGSVFAVKYGPLEHDTYALGSLNLLNSQLKMQTVAVTTQAQSMGGRDYNETEDRATLPHWSCDLIVMNPPFTRDTSHEGDKKEAPNPMFAAFNITAEQQREMARFAEQLLKGTSWNGNAGEGSAFLALADRKLDNNGTLAIVMPLSLMAGDSWESSRQLLRKSYGELTLISIAAAKDSEISFSADTDMGECLVIGQKANTNNSRATFVVLNERPSSPIVGSITAAQIRTLQKEHMRKLEDGPMGGSLLHFGDDIIGYAIDAPLPIKGPWNLARIKDGVLAQIAYQMASENIVWLGGMRKEDSIPISIATVSAIGQIGPIARDINEVSRNGKIRGPFKIEAIRTNSAPTYPVLWAHNAQRERCMEFEADSEGFIHRGRSPEEERFVQDKAMRIWNTASHCHSNVDFRFNSQSTGMQFTPVKTIGGRAWPSIKLASIEQEKALVLWSNSSLGFLLRWWHANRQVAGRGSIGVSSLALLPVLDVTSLSKRALSNAVTIFDELKHQELRPINEINQDTVRADIDSRLAMEVLGFPPELASPDGPLGLLRRKLALEPSITGSKPLS